jgi:hypothetical protein
MLGVPPQCYNPNLLAFSKSPFDNLLGGSGQDKGNPGRSWAEHPPRTWMGTPFGPDWGPPRSLQWVSSGDGMDTGPVLALEPLSTILPGNYWHLQHPPGLGQADAVPRRRRILGGLRC